MTTKEAYALGYSCGMNGANTTNCNFRAFSTPENTRAWERGKKDAEEIKDGVKKLNEAASGA